MGQASEVTIELLLSSPTHRYEGRPGDGPLPATTREVFESIQLRAGLGVVGDRYFGQRAHRQASVTIMAAESLDWVQDSLGLLEHPLAENTRRNIIVRGMPIDEMGGSIFTLDSGSGPVSFVANRPANPCAWMNVTLAPGAFQALRGRGGMRCEPLSDGTLSVGPAELRMRHA
ncbi:molybdenum cofactor biosysynthesis protein [Glaciihabitans arcticus]|uniref:Molybdenum cofactor biosysynthesis protein n=1 Tax=Glaciihabitans arcticus TaxID=2668039 RepID=A0A4Q9GYQ9_9MICO|nr:MOSC domain-containing protein [Glaciihabitans arcticus]TBN57470.1 molybdenum cofactor biosysynthesis protein [Glaciihabitans arcticus]